MHQKRSRRFHPGQIEERAVLLKQAGLDDFVFRGPANQQNAVRAGAAQGVASSLKLFGRKPGQRGGRRQGGSD